MGGWFLGDLLDRQLGTSPWIALSCLLVGTAGAFWETVRIVERAWGEESSPSPEPEGETSRDDETEEVEENEEQGKA